jgi:hypothetical protein
MNVMWSILIAHWAHRADRFERLLTALLPQCERTPALVEVVALRNRGGSLPMIRQWLLDSARGTWVNFIDDDDMVPDYYADEILTCLIVNPAVDYIGFQVMKDWDSVAGIPGGISDHSLRHSGRTGDFADYSHLNPVRTSIARTGSYAGYRGGNRGEDNDFRNQIISRLRQGTEAYISRIMYYYRWDLADSVQRAGYVPAQSDGTPAPVVRSPVFRWHERSELD